MRTIRLIRGVVWGCLFLFACPAAAEEPAIAVTVYNNNLGLVRERRAISLDEGVSVYSFTDVAALIDPTSVHFRPVDGRGGLEVLEQNFEYDLVSSEKLFEKYLEHPVEIFLEEGADVIRGELLSFRGGSFVLKDSREGRISVVQQEAIRNVEFLGDAGDFVTRPTLVWTVENEGAGERDVEIEYLTAGISWHAEYVALADEPNESIHFAGWVSVENRSGADYRRARLKLMAGDVARAETEREVLFAEARAMGAKAAPVTERPIFEYHLYEVERPTTIGDNQVKQISFVPTRKVPVVKEYLFDPSRQGEKVGVFLEFQNEKDHGLGIALPAGLVRVFQDDGRGGSEFIGEDRIDHTPRNEKVRLRIGYAFDLVGEKKITEERRITDRERLRTVEITLRNRKDSAVEIKVWDRIEGDWAIEQESRPHRKEDVRTAEWIVPVPADGEEVLTYTVRIRY